jgi:hypothetical protein
MKLFILILFALSNYTAIAAEPAPCNEMARISAAEKRCELKFPDRNAQDFKDCVFEESACPGTNLSSKDEMCKDAKKKFTDAQQTFGKACPENRRPTTTCERQAAMCISECKSADGKIDSLCSKENDRDILKEARAQRESAIKAKPSGLNLAKPLSTDKLYYCPPYAGKELVKYNKLIKDQKEDIQSLEDDIKELKGKLSTDENSIEGQLSELQVDFKAALEKAKEKYDTKMEELESGAKGKEKELNTQFQGNVDKIEGLKLKLKDIENQRVVSLRKEGDLVCLKKGQDCVDAKIAERTMLLKTNSLKSRGGLMGTLNNTGKKMIEKSCTNIYNQCLKNPVTTAVIEAINRQFDLQNEATHKEIQGLIQQNASVITQLNEIDPEKTKTRQKETDKYGKETESLRASFSAKEQQLQKTKAALEQQIKSKELKLTEDKSQYAVDTAYSKAAVRAFGSQADEEDTKTYQSYIESFGSLERAASEVESYCPDEKDRVEVEKFKASRGGTSRSNAEGSP